MSPRGQPKTVVLSPPNAATLQAVPHAVGTPTHKIIFSATS